jgi:hypothetical protein
MFREPLTIHLVRLIYRQMHASGEAGALLAYQALSWACGALYVFFSLLLADAVGRNRRERNILRLFLLTVGTVELFCGYVENYAPLTLAVLAYLYVAWRYLDNRVSLIAPGMVWGLAFTLHFSALVFFPSLVFLYFMEWRRNALSPGFFLRLAITPVLVFAIFSLIGFDPGAAFRHQGVSSQLVPLWTPEPFYRPHTLLSSVHLLDVMNQHLLIAPMGLVLITATLFTVRSRRHTPHFILLSAAAVFYILFASLLNPLIGAFRDWDLLSPMAVPIALLSAYLLTRCTEAATQARLGWVVAVVTLFHLIPWLWVNADADRSLARSAVILKDGARLSVFVRGEGNDQLRNLYERIGKKREALEAAKVALNAQPRRSWLLSNAFRLTEEVEGSEKAELFLKSLIARDPDFDFSRFRLAYLYFQKNDLNNAISEYRQVVRINPNFAEAHNNLGVALEKKGDTDSAIRAYRQAIKANAGFVNVYYSLGAVLASKRDSIGAIQEYRNYIRLSTDEHWKKAAQDSIRWLGGTP